jgi:hypothetical protein
VVLRRYLVVTARTAGVERLTRMRLLLGLLG